VPYESVQAAPRPYATAIGQRQTVNLEDGSSITLNTQSRVSVLFGPREREVRLLTGEVFFHVAHDPDRPFRVFSNGILLEDLGTDFNVYNYRSETQGPGASPSGTRVSVLNGSVRIYCNCVGDKPASAPDSGSVHPAAPSPFLSEFLVAGQKGEITHVDGVDRLQIQKLSKDDLRAVTAWRDGEIILNKMTLAQAVQEFNRYNLLQMTVSPEIAQLVVGGRFDNPDYRSFVSALSVQYHIEALAPNSLDNPSPALRLVRRSAVP
jgi:transmembrane sensor